MQKLVLYEHGFPRNIKQRNRVNIIPCLNAMNSYKPVIDVYGCVVTNTSSYVDVMFTQDNSIDINVFSYLKVSDEVNRSIYFGYIDRVEPNNFNKEDENLYFRIYFTVDWWTTLCQNEVPNVDNFLAKLEGNVERAHVNDVKRSGSYFNANLDYTLREAEFRVSKFQRREKRIGTGKYFLYVLSSKDVDYKNPSCYTKLHNKEIPYPLHLYIIPLFDCNIRYNWNRDGAIVVKSYFNTTSNYPTIPLPEYLTDRSIYSIYCTDVCPCYDPDNNALNYYGVDEGYFVGDVKHWYSDDLSIATTFSIFDGAQIIAYKTIGEVNSINYQGTFTIGSKAFLKPDNYQTYLLTITKQYFAPYSFTYISGNGEIPIDTVKHTGYFSYNIIPSTGTIGFYLQNETLYEEAKYKYINDGVYEILGENDSITALKKVSASLRAVSGYKNFIEGFVSTISGGSVFSGGVNAGLSGLSSMASGAIDYAQLAVGGDSGYQTSSTAISRYLKPTSVVELELYSSEISSLQKDLALYGYNTYLHPHEILENHKRKYFNYIKLNNASINVTNLQTEIKLQLEEMFNNGVWIWNTVEEFGNFEVPNYPILMEQ